MFVKEDALDCEFQQLGGICFELSCRFAMRCSNCGFQQLKNGFSLEFLEIDCF